ncbi:AzlC family ABC transporter permease [Curvivirga aplysinae]|uniref:AzlC family ABC transporter permease n=1 Tax=Curvivirga aplysinae TaxID=2529852 RepID=UPI0012BCF589|nr:AzlC family ABC transporter permease [Curvivirga aplysinae]MTI10678.1 AzlC family protein [Curvivirga aplysinae]
MRKTSEYYTGVMDITPLAMGVAVYGVAFGLLAAQAQMSSLQTAMMGLFVFAGGSQIVATERLVADAGAIAAITAGVALNLRMLLMTAALRDDLKGRPLWQILLGAHYTTDENWALLHAKRAKGVDVGYWYFISGGAFIMLIWIISTVAGVSFASLVPEPKSIGVDFAFTAAFIAILCSLWRGKEDLFPWIISISTAVLLASLAPIETSWALVIGGVVGALSAGVLSGKSRDYDLESVGG